MTKPKSIIRSLNDYYNKKNDKYRKIFDKYEKITYKVEFDNNGNPELIARDLNTDSIILLAECQTIGVYNEDISMWYWSWSVPFINKKLYKNLTDLKQFPEKMKKNSKDYVPHEMEEVYFYLTNNGLYCQKSDIIPPKIALYLTKGEWVVPISKTNDNIKITEYVLITDIKNFRK